jgi:8-oxo-dGTP diphosphatase
MQTVVGAAIVRRGALLAARRTGPAATAGRWELPGGKVEPGESPEDALVREIAEELGCTVVVTDWLERSVPVRPGLTLRVAVAHLVDGLPEPVEHDELRWLDADELDDVDWLEADRPFLPDLRGLLTRPRPRGVFDERDEAAAVVARLRSEGYEAWTERERFAGEDDDEDHAWAVLTDAPAVRLELLIEEHDGWFDATDATEATDATDLAHPAGPHATTPPTPLDLPRTPRR